MAAAAAALGSAWAAARSGRGDRELGAVVAELAASSSRQAESMTRLAQLSAQSMRAATGTYVFQLRDRFDESLPPVQLGMSTSSWAAVGEAPGPVEALVFHPGDTVRFLATLVCNQAPLTRRVVVSALEPSLGANAALPPQSHPSGLGLTVGQPAFTAAGTPTVDDSDHYALRSDHSLFIAVPLDLAIDGLAVGPFARRCWVAVTVTDSRPEGVVSTVRVGFDVLGVAVADDDGIGLECLAIEAAIGIEDREYFLDKTNRLRLTLPV